MPIRTHSLICLAGAAAVITAGTFGAPAQAETPLSAIDWLGAARLPVVHPPLLGPGQLPLADEPPVSHDATVPDVSVAPLDAPKPDAVGLLPTAMTGLPQDLWQNSTSHALVALLRTQKAPRLPALQDLLYTLLLAEANAPADAGNDSALLLARIDALIEFGAVEPAAALIDRAGADTAPLFARWFDITLLTGAEDEACAALLARPALSPSYAAQVFCTARTGDWETAALTLDTARALNLISSSDSRLLEQFLHPDTTSEGQDLPPPARPSALTYRLFEAVGAPLPTGNLPRAFAMGDLRDTSGWKSELEAAERLTRSGALAANRLQGYYTARQPAASGGVWDRVAAFQRFDAAFARRDVSDIAKTLPDVWAAMRAARLEIAFADLYGAELYKLPLSGTPRALAYHIALLSQDYETAAQSARPVTRADRFLTTLAMGTPRDPHSPRAEAITAAFAPQARPPAAITSLLRQRRLGEAILRAVKILSEASGGDTQAITEALATFRAVGLEATARRAGLQMILLDRQG
ncbi:hypothetical protein [Litorivita pollutaquae]|uniref:hypothetical protein n=1 Tax=Litorivita pollutaquae TaxID=2200892 RepID=UPI001F292148|nr:hypothetical protein [Litorivita pollutaquae]